MYRKVIYIVLCVVLSNTAFCQEIELFQQFNGRYDYLAIGNTLNQFENNIDRSFCEILPESSADLNLASNRTIIAAYLYWAGSGTGDDTITLNNTEFVADNIYTVDYNDATWGLLNYFSCYADITDYILSTGNGTYTFSDLDISETLNNNEGYCENRTNFGGWSIYIIYEDTNLPINQINLFQGLDIINRNVQELIISLDNVNVLDNTGAKIGFLAWEGDAILDFGESLLINGNLISNPPLNLGNNAFNGTNSFTNSSTFYNADLDVYNIENNIEIGDTSVEIKLTTGDFDEFGILRADLIIINNIITVLNSQLPDATVQLDDFTLECASRDILCDYTVYNVNCTEVLPALTPIAFYANNELVAQSETLNTIPIDGSETQSISITIPESISDNFILELAVDDDGTRNGIVIELNELNNSTYQDMELIPEPPIVMLQPLLACDVRFDTAEFDLTEQLEHIEYNSIDDVVFYESYDDLLNQNNAISIPEMYDNRSNPQSVFIRVENTICFDNYIFDLTVENCPPYIPEVFTPNDDGFNDWFNIQGLYDIFENHKLLIYNRFGTLIFEGNNNLKWYGRTNRGINNLDKLVPVGTYFYVLYPNDNNYKTWTGWVYVNY
ncbi:T9SS type B sorting domain-containing protein [Hanstruepera marina]|uniref:T9SS type B sorting domain-containing protein n=1 Tax=Hanstruepera marina TaxID=2873265 RepID=UPI001CA6ECFE|nr:gliding motility-associated C-terminal domain-containing protein [Hanstruepera marina]